MSIMSKSFAAALVGVALSAMAVTAADAAVYKVDAYLNSTGGGVGVPTLSLSAGQSFSVSVNPGDLWSGGEPLGWSNANGAIGNLFATGSDDSGKAAGTLIGINLGTLTQGGLTAPYYTLVGQIGSGNYFVLGTSYAGTAPTAGTLKLSYFDAYAGDNKQFITATVTSAVPELSTWAMMLIGFAGLAFASQRKRVTAAA
jgi:hypothetical protein